MNKVIPQVAVRFLEESSLYIFGFLLDTHVLATWHLVSKAPFSLFLLALSAP